MSSEDHQRWRYLRTLVDLITFKVFCYGGEKTDEFSEKFQGKGGDSEVPSSSVSFFYFSIQLLKKAYPEP